MKKSVKMKNINKDYAIVGGTLAPRMVEKARLQN